MRQFLGDQMGEAARRIVTTLSASAFEIELNTSRGLSSRFLRKMRQDGIWSRVVGFWT